MANSIYKNRSFELLRDRFVEGDLAASVNEQGALKTADGTMIDAAVEAPFPKLSSGCPMLDAMYGIAIRDHERVTIDPKSYLYMLCARYIRDFKIPGGMLPEGSVFWAGYGFNTYLYTRDTAYSSWLGTAYLLPDVVKSHLQYLRKIRRRLGWKVSQAHDIPIEGIPTEVLDVGEKEIAYDYNTNSYTRRTDDIVWVLGLWEVYKSTRDDALLTYMLEEFAYFDEHFYRYFLDSTTGLYRGQSSFIDIGGAPYGGRNASNTVVLKTLSTNCLYVGCFEILRKAAVMSGREDVAASLQQRHDALAEAIRTHFGAVDYHYWLDDEGGTSGRQEVLGLAFLTLFDIVPREEGARLLADYHDGDYGRPLMWPFCGSDRVYHDNSTWPFADTIYALAEYKVGNREEVVRKTMGKLCRHGLNGDFNEVLKWETGEFVGCPSYIWSAASYLALVYRMIAGMEVSETGTVSFAPVLPAELGDRLDLSGITIGGMTVNLHVRGNGEKLARCLVDGEEREHATLDVDSAAHEVEVHLE